MITSQITRVMRQSWLLLLCCGAIGVLGNTIVSKTPTKSTLREPTTFNFPQTVPLSEWQLLESKSLARHKFENGTIATGGYYRYQRSQQSTDRTAIAIDIRYLTDGVANRPTVDAMLPIFTKVPAAALQPNSLKERAKLGYYSLFIHKETAYFSTCINPQGITTVTGDQFHSNSNPSPLTGIPVDRLLPWLLGQQTLRDSRCLWTVLSTPIDRAAPDATMKTLETIGVTWIRWWQMHFPAA